MSLNDEFKAAKKRFLAQQEQEKAKATTKKKSQKSQKSAEWTFENEIVAYYLQKFQASKFIKENYSKKLNVSARSMSIRMTMFKDLGLGGKPKALGTHSLGVIEKYGSFPADELLKVVISILRNEFNHTRSLDSHVDSEAQGEAKTIIKRESAQS